MKISILTLFPEMFSGPFSESIIKRASEKKLVSINICNLRNFGIGKHKVVDNKPFGGGIGMLLRVDVMDKAIESLKDNKLLKSEQKSILLDAGGKIYNQGLSQSYSRLKHLILICGHYEGFDERVKTLVDEIISIGDFILTGGEIPAMMITDSIIRLIPGVLKKEASSHESFSIEENGETNLLEYPQYTLPREYKGITVPEILISGNHKAIETWKKEKSILITRKNRPDLLKNL